MSETTAILAAYPAFVRKLFNRSGDPSKDFAHAILGIVTELHELANATDGFNALEEKGDLSFYLRALIHVVCDHTGKSSDQILADADEDDAYAYNDGHTTPQIIAGASNFLLDQAKRWVGYNKEPENLAAVTVDAARLVHMAFEYFQWPEVPAPLEEILAANMRKLLKRYPDGEFSQLHALVRDLDGERKVLEDAAALG